MAATRAQLQQAYREGIANGRADRRIGVKNAYAWAGAELDAPNTYAHWYGMGYQAGWSAKHRSAVRGTFNPMGIKDRLISELTQLNEREGGPVAHHRLGLYLRAADDFARLVNRGTDPSSAFARVFVPTRSMHRIARQLGLRLTVKRGEWIPNPSFRYVYRPGALDRAEPTVIQGRPIAPGTLVRVLAKRPAGGRAIRGWARTFAWIADHHGNEQIVFRRALEKTSAHGY